MSAPVIGADRLREVVGFEDLIEPVSRAFQEFSAGLAHSGLITLYPAPRPELGDVYVKTGAIRGHAAYIVKVSPWFAANAQVGRPQGGLVAVFDAETGYTIAILDDQHYLSDIRTAAAGAVVARALAPETVRVVGVLGAGVQAFWQPQALAQARRFETLLLWSRDRVRAAGLAERLRPKLGPVVISIAASAEEVARTCDVLITTTSSREPIVRGEWLRPGQHITAIGADDPSKCELDAACMSRADRLIVDSMDSAQHNGDVHRWLERGDLGLAQVHGELGHVLSGALPGRSATDEITIGKLVGLGVQDLVAAEVALDKLRLAFG